MTLRTRIAPSPTGYLHIGSLATALRNYAYAKGRDGQFVIRIEDTDRERYVEGAVEAVLKVLKDYGLDWDEGPDIGGSTGPYIQSQRLDTYQQHAQQLIDGGHAYYCFCTKDRLAEMRQHQQDHHQLPKYDRHCLHLSPEEVKANLEQHLPHVVRLKVPHDQQVTFTDLIRGDITFSTNEIDDQVLLKSDGFPTYHLGVVTDDHLMNISHIIRGEEWISSTPKHVLLYQAFGWPVPVYAHTPDFLSPTGKGKMSKRQGDVSAQSFLDKGYLPQAMLNFLMIMGWAPEDQQEVLTLDQFIHQFDIAKVSAKSVTFDLNKLNWLNGLYIRKLSDQDLQQQLTPYKPTDMSAAQFRQVIPLVKERLEYLSQFTEMTAFFVSNPDINLHDLLKESKVTAADTADYLAKVQTTLESLSDWSVAAIESALHQFQQDIGWKPRPAFMTIRLAVTGRPATPPLFDTLHVIGQSTVITRLSHAQKILRS